MLLIYGWTPTYTEDTWLWSLSLVTDDVFQASEIRGAELLNLYPALFTAVDKNGAIVSTGVKKVVTTTITTAEVLALNATPIELVAAPAAWSYIVVDRVTASIDYVAAAYATNTTLEVRYWTATTKATADIASLLAVTADTVQSVWGIEAELSLPIADNIEINVATGNPITGDSDVKITVEYRVLSI